MRIQFSHGLSVRRLPPLPQQLDVIEKPFGLNERKPSWQQDVELTRR
jgi:hypothetical protein